MSQVQPFSEAFIKQICATYGMHEPLIEATRQNHRELKMYVGMMRTMLEMSDEPNPDAIAMFTRLIAHMDSTMAMLNRLHEAARQANTVMGEYTV